LYKLPDGAQLPHCSRQPERRLQPAGCNISFESSKPKKFWSKITTFIQDDRGDFEWLLAHWIVVLQGKKGWDDYLLLAHFDPSVQTDDDSLKSTQLGPACRGARRMKRARET
jgi:hypothetical protein